MTTIHQFPGRNNQKYSRNRRRKSPIPYIIIAVISIILITAITCFIVYMVKENQKKSPEALLSKYMNHIKNKEYEALYEMIDPTILGTLTKEEFVQRNQGIYEGIEAENLTVTITKYDKKGMTVLFETAMDTLAGPIQFHNTAFFMKGEEGYKISWTDALIFPGLSPSDKVKVSTTQAVRGEILDRNGEVLAGKGVASNVGIVPGKLQDKEAAIALLAEILGIQPDSIVKKLEAKWVKDDYFVPIMMIPKLKEIGTYEVDDYAEFDALQAREVSLLEIPGVMISDTEVRGYPLEKAAAHLIGYVQNVTAEDLEKHKGEGYTAASVIGRTGLESLYEKELKGSNGCKIYVVDSEGTEKGVLAELPVKHGDNIKTTIDSKLQKSLYQQYKQDKGCSVAMNPYTGEVLALVSTPSYDDNDFITGLSNEKWTALNEDVNRPMYNRFRQVWSPGSTFKPITAAIGLASGAIDPNEDYGNVGLSWKKDSSWGAYSVTTLHAYEPVVLENAFIYSDNIYFAKSALKIGAEQMASSLNALGFNQEIPFEINMSGSQFSNAEGIENEIQLADTGYGQGQVLMNPLHLACIYSAFVNEGNVISPYLLYEPDKGSTYWLPQAFSKEHADRILESLKKVVNDPNGTGYGASRSDVLLAGKTGTAEIKESKDDETGTELGWFTIFTTDPNVQRPILVITMIEDVKERGGSGYVVETNKQIMETWLNGL